MRSVTCGWRPSPPKLPSPMRTPTNTPRSKASSCFTVMKNMKHPPGDGGGGEVGALRLERRDDETALGLLALAVRLHVAPVAQVLVHEPALGRRHGVERHRGAEAHAVAGGLVRVVAQDRRSPLPVPRSVDGHPLAGLLVHGHPVGQVLQRVDGLPAPPDDQPQVLAADHDRDLLLVLGDLDVAAELEGAGDVLDELPHPVGRGAHQRRLPERFFFLRGGGGGGPPERARPFPELSGAPMAVEPSAAARARASRPPPPVWGAVSAPGWPLPPPQLPPPPPDP